MHLPTLDIVIVNWNTGNQLHVTLESIAAAAQESFSLSSVIIVDNASQDHSAHADRLSMFRLPICVIYNTENRGFAAACNQGAQAGTAKYILFLNPDTHISHSSLEESIHTLEDSANSHIAALGVQLISGDGTVSRSCARHAKPSHFINRAIGLDRLWPQAFPSYMMYEWDHLSSRAVEHVIGAYFWVRRIVFEALAGFDERFFMYLEDLDLCLRIRQSGHQIFYLTTTSAYHKGGGASEQVKSKRLFYALRSRILYAHKHFSRTSAILITLITLLVEPCIRLAIALIHRSIQEISELAGAYRSLWQDLPQWAGIVRQSSPLPYSKDTP